jgi:hypothetical protein
MWEWLPAGYDRICREMIGLLGSTMEEICA